jgi:cytochrome c biogenesis protein
VIPRTLPARPAVPVRIGRGAWGLLTSVNFAVAQIIVLALLGVVGMTIRQLPSFAFRSLADYQSEMARLRAIYEPTLGASAVDILEQLGVFRMFTSPWFSTALAVLVLSIIVCTLDRTPRLWRQSAIVRVVQPAPFYDPELPDRAVVPAAPPADTIGAILRRHRFRVRTERVGDVLHLYGDRNQWTKLATLLTHLGLILFLVAAAVTTRFGDEQGLVVAEGDSLTVGPIGTPGLLLVRNFDFEAPGLETGQATDFTTDLGVYRDGQLLARKTIRVNDPLEAGGYSFHQNGFGPAPNLLVRDGTGATLWSGPVPMTEQHEGFPFGIMAVPGRDVGLQLLLDRSAAGGAVLLVLPYRMGAPAADGSQPVTVLDPMAIETGETQTVSGLDFTVSFPSMSDYTVLIARRDPGQAIVWMAFGTLISGILITFYLPRRRVWARLAANGELALVGRSDRYVDFDREFGRLLEDLVSATPRQPAGVEAGGERRPAPADGGVSNPGPARGLAARRRGWLPAGRERPG